MKLTEQQLREYVRNAVVESLNEAALDEGWLDNIRAAGDIAGAGLRNVGNRIKQGVQDFQQQSKARGDIYQQQRDVKNFNKKLTNAQGKATEIVDNKIMPILNGIPGYRQSIPHIGKIRNALVNLIMKGFPAQQVAPQQQPLGGNQQPQQQYGQTA